MHSFAASWNVYDRCSQQRRWTAEGEVRFSILFFDVVVIISLGF